MKYILSKIFYYSGISYIIFKFNNLFFDIRVVNYHCTPSFEMYNFENQLKFYKKHFTNVSFAQLQEYFQEGTLNSFKKPGLIITFDDGLRSNFDFALPLLEKYGFTGWFFVPAEFISKSNYSYLLSHNINLKQIYQDGRYSMNSTELKTLSKNHVIGSHTYTHHRMMKNNDSTILSFQILNSKKELENIIERTVDIFCWVGGELQHYTKEAHEYIKHVNYKFSFTTNNLMINKNTDPFNINRTNIETNYSISLLIFQISGLMDLFYYKKRRQVAKIFKK
jgi:peptidoglycan/xylan/chitin deacetylase (PgdA/CDA1 family)